MLATVRCSSGSLRIVRMVFFGSIFFVAAFLFYITRLQFLTWSGGDLSSYLLPPYTTIYYFLEYALFHFWASYLVSFLAGVIFLKLAQYFNKKHGGKFFEKEEPYFIGLSIFLAGHPGWFLYLTLISGLTLLFALVNWLRTKQVYRISCYHFWLPLGLAVILLDRILLAYWPFYQTFIFAR